LIPFWFIFPHVTVDRKPSRAARVPWPVTASDTRMVLFRSMWRISFLLGPGAGPGGSGLSSDPTPFWVTSRASSGSGTRVVWESAITVTNYKEVIEKRLNKAQDGDMLTTGFSLYQMPVLFISSLPILPHRKL
jgi:hypothetical protein